MAGVISGILGIILGFLNFILILFGGGLIAIGTFAYVQTPITGNAELSLTLQNFLAFLPKELVIGVIVTGIVVFSISVLGFCGITSRVLWMLATYTCFIFLLLGGEIAIVVILNEFGFPTKSILSLVWDNLNDDGRRAIQEKGQCCGFSGPTDRISTSAGIAVCTVTKLNPSASPPGCSTFLENQVNNQLSLSQIQFILYWIIALTGLILVSSLYIYRKQSRERYYANMRYVRPLTGRTFA